MFSGALARPPWDNQEPIRAELFSLERLEEHARSLAAAQPVTARRGRGLPLADRLADNEAMLLEAHRATAKAIAEGGAITPAAEWLIDNYYVVEKQIREIRLDLPPGYYRELPKLAEGPLVGYPRVLGLAWAFVAHTDSRFDAESLCRFVRAYQDVQPLTIGELWAVAITLRIVLIENLRRLAERIVHSAAARQEADHLADRLLGVGQDGAESATTLLAKQDRAPLTDAFAVQLAHRLRDQDPRIAPALDWLERRLAARGTNTDEVVRDEHQRQGAGTVTVRNIVTSMRLISDVDWADLVERISLVDDVLGGEAFRAMDFPTRNLYRTAIQELARGAGRSELDVASAAVQAASRARAADPSQDARLGDPGYYLLSRGRRVVEAEIGYRSSLSDLLRRLNAGVGITGYAGAVIVVAAILLTLPLAALSWQGLSPLWLGLLGVLGIVPAIDASVAAVNYAATSVFGARLLPALELRGGVPAHLRTVVAVPALLADAATVEELIERLEVHHLASPEGDLHFALLSDWLDADAETVPGDDALLEAAAQGMARLNQLYGPGPGGPRFLLLHRRRVWNPGEGRWIGWERKRGKLHELNRLLRGATDTTFIDMGGVQPSAPGDVRYVITLDSDTRLPRETVRRLIGKMAHPLNRPRLDPAAGRVVEGYGILQPRVTPSLPVGSGGSAFQRIFSSVSGIDPYALAVSDVYQDLFDEGSYSGKGIYDIDAFEAALRARAPDSTLLSHDLFEGVFARAGFASDVEVVEEFPVRYSVSAKRQHRWARGDWQLLPWIFGRGPSGAGSAPRGGVPPVGRWKMVDNLRRSLSAPMAVAALAAGWATAPGAALIWTVFVLATLMAPAMIPVVGAIAVRRPGLALRAHLRTLGQDFRAAISLSAMTLVLLADQAWLMGDAIARTLGRLFITHRRLLEWSPAALAASGPDLDLAGSYRRMLGVLPLGALALVVSLLAGRGGWIVAAPFVLLWFLSPAVALWAGRPAPDASRVVLSDADARMLRLTARRTWRFFETFVTAADNMLPPDNFQQEPVGAVAHRTSPTNIGLYLLSVASARDFGWIGTTEAIGRLEATFATLDQLPKFRGHLYNWYDTTDLRTLEPQYISSVDSGNLAGHLIALANACREWRAEACPPALRLAGIADTLDIARDEAGHLSDGRRTQTVTRRQLHDALALLTTGVRRSIAEGDDCGRRLDILAGQAQTATDIVSAFAIERGGDSGADLLHWVEAAWRAIESHRLDINQGDEAAKSIEARLCVLEDTARATALAMEFDFLLDPDRKLLSIGFLAPEGRLDPSCYDLLASEARLASFVAIAKGDVPARHWFHLGRTVTPVARGAALVSWSGSMFEYLMPSLVMRAPSGSLVEQTNRLIVKRQIEYGADLGVPWGVSESAYNARDLELTYQYSNFGVPGLGLKRGLGENAVIAPYATALATMIDPRAAVKNLARLESIGARGRYGFYEALDYTPERLPEGSKVAVVCAFMAHHQGMSIVAIADTLLGGLMRARFHSEPMVQATELLLQERTPRDVPMVRPWAAEVKSAARIRELEAAGARWIATPHDASPATHLLSNGRYAVMLTAAGSGYSRWRDIAVTRWREDPTCDDLGSYIFLRDVGTGEVWSAGFQPSGAEPYDYGAYFSEDTAEIVRRDGSLSTAMEVVVSAEDDAEVRRVSITNSGATAREIEITSYAELVLTTQPTDVAHPAFAKMFVETEYLPALEALLATRRRRTPSEPEVWAAHVAVVDGESIGKVEVETDRARFLGRGGGVRRPIAMIDGRPLSNTTGDVLDPIFALRHRLRVPPRSTARIAFWTMAASTREVLLDMIDRHRDVTAYERAATLSWTQAQVQLHHLSIDRAEASLFQRLAGHLIYAGPALRPSSDIIWRGGAGQPGLWSQGISGDLPILLLRISEIENLDIVRQLLRAHEYWRLKQLAVDLVILNDRASSYVQDLQNAIETLVRTRRSVASAPDPAPGGRVFTLRSDMISPETRALLPSVARAVLVAERGRMADQLDRAEVKPASRPIVRSRIARGAPGALPHLPDLEFFNGLGGFADQGREYVTILGPGQSTPAPWINVVANAAFGFQVSAEGSGYTWSVNSRENQLTPWSNDPVSDPVGEALYLRDDDTGDLWSPTAQPIREETGVYIARHGRGYSRFEHTAHGVASDLVQYVPLEGSIKISRLQLRNTTGRPRRLSLTAYVEWVLGTSRAASAAYVMTQIDSETGALFARNPWTPVFAPRIAFADLGGRQSDWTGDRREFIGRNGSLASPAALAGVGPLSNTVGAGLDPCAALRTSVELPPYGAVELVFFLGEAASADEARAMITRYRAADLDAVRAEVTAFWDDVLGQVQVKTPDRSMDVMLNGWLLYQTLACRIWARSAFYQASGAYGFRDQLQDGMAIAAARPAFTRAHLLEAASRQFPEGDVQHWWLPHSGQGVRTRISDDRSWLAYTVAHYVNATGDAAVLDEPIAFLEGPQLHPEEVDSFYLPTKSERTATLFEHCALALDQSLALGAHGLPLMGSGDWNDGMNRVGEKGRGESVWLAWLLHATLMAFAPFSEARHETVRAATWRAHAAALKASLEREAWDGDWYLRGFYDDGSPLGSSKSEECQIDSIAQSWAVISGAADTARAASGMAEVEQRLIRPADGVALLFEPPFDKTVLDPGYIKGYPPGIRENGGQYTHAATWSVMALTALGEGDEAAALFSLLNPINHARTRAEVHRYKVEPYVVAADVYAVAPHIGRGGWTWYTGSAGWLQRAGVESILGVKVLGDTLHVDPCIPKAWPGFELSLRHGASRYELRVENPNGVCRGVAFAELDGVALNARPLIAPLVDDGATHRLLIRLGGA